MLAALIPLLVVAGTMLSVESSQMRETESVGARMRARSISAGGAHDAIARLESDPGYTGTSTVALDAGTAVVTVVDCAGDGLDNDGNGRVDDATEIDLLTIRSEGLLGFDVDGAGNVLADHGRNWRATTEVVLRRTRLDTVFDSALYVDNPLAKVHFTGNSFTISGVDLGIDGKPSGNADCPGIGSPGDPSSIAGQFSKSQKNNVKGEGGFPSVLEVASLDIPTLIEQLEPLASLRWKDDASFHGDIGDRAKLAPVVAYAAGDLKINGKTSGCGILIVEGDLEIGGAFDFAGIVVVGKTISYHGGGSRAILGTVVTAGDLDHSNEMKGSVTVQFSSAAIDLARALGSSFDVVAWRQS
jgi:hypothetical protein